MIESLIYFTERVQFVPQSGWWRLCKYDIISVKKWILWNGVTWNFTFVSWNLSRKKGDQIFGSIWKIWNLPKERILVFGRRTFSWSEKFSAGKRNYQLKIISFSAEMRNFLQKRRLFGCKEEFSAEKNVRLKVKNVQLKVDS